MNASPFKQELDELTLAGLQKRSRSAQSTTYQMYADAAWNLAVRITGCETRAWDAVQDAFVAAFERSTQFRGPTGFGFWLRQIVVRKVMDGMRHERKMSSLPEVDTEGPSSLNDEHIDIEQALARLDDTDRLIVWLHDAEGLTHAEIAEQAGQSVSWSKSRLSRARAQLQQWTRNDMNRIESSLEVAR